MGFTKSKHQGDGESEGKKWVIAGIPLRGPPRSISTKKLAVKEDGSIGGDDQTTQLAVAAASAGPTTPTSKASRIPEKLACPPPPRKRRPASTCHNDGVREFFNHPDLEAFFMAHYQVERAI